MKKNILLLSFFTIVLSSCEFKCNVGKTTDTGTGAAGDYKNSINTSQIMNDIEISATGDVKVYRAFLSDEAGNLIKDNTTSVGKTIKLHLSFESGWHEENGKVMLGAAQIITTDKGRQVLDSGDLFANNTEGVSAEASKGIALDATIDNVPEEIEYYQVNFHVWDKKGNGEVKGSYKFKVQ